MHRAITTYINSSTVRGQTLTHGQVSFPCFFFLATPDFSSSLASETLLVRLHLVHRLPKDFFVCFFSAYGLVGKDASHSIDT